jgi:Uma2 family endonuclease
MTTSRIHERFKKLLGTLVEMLTLELNIPIQETGSMTLKRQLKERGIEADESYYLANERRVRGKKDIDLNTDPPPDLALEIDISRSWLDRMSIYAALKIPEVWCFDGKALQVYVLQPSGDYELSEKSLNFPFLPVQELVPFVQLGLTTDDTTLRRTFLDWVRKQAPTWQITPPSP